MNDVLKKVYFGSCIYRTGTLTKFINFIDGFRRGAEGGVGLLFSGIFKMFYDLL